MLRTLSIAMIFSLQSGASATFEVDLWPGEGRPVFEAVAQQLRLRESPSESSEVLETITVRPRQRLAFDETRYRTMKPGRFFVLAATGITGRRLGDASRLSRSDYYYSGKFGPASVTVMAGETVEYFTVSGRGHLLRSHRGLCV
jgi:hypothetical protein